MNTNIHCSQKKPYARLGKKAAVLVLFFIIFLLFTTNPKSARADEMNCNCFITIASEFSAENILKDKIPMTVGDKNNLTDSEKKQCTDLCIAKNYTGGTLKWKTAQVGPATTKGTWDPISSALSSALGWVFQGLLIVILTFVGWMVSASVALFELIIKVDNMNAILDNPGLYKSWSTVRDLLNMSFILVLLFSAFSTIFQIEKYNYKKILLTLVIMALLVNFSFPITRGIIDVSNTLMYTLIKNNIGAENSMGMIAETSGIQDIISAGQSSNDTAYIVAAIIFGFIFAITLWGIGIMLVIRIIALAILIIFSPIAFVGAIISLPSSGNYTNKFWDNLFRYAFFGPIMMFMIYIATQIMGFMGNPKLNLGVIASKHAVDPNIIASIAFFSIPIVVLWIGLGTAQSMSIAGAGAVMGQAQKMAKWGGRQTYKLPWKGIKATGVPGGVKQKYENIRDSFESARQTRESRIAGLGPFKVPGSMEKDMRRRAEEYKKKGYLKDELKEMAKKGDTAAAYRLAEDKDMDQTTYDAFTLINKDKKIQNAINSKVKQDRADIAAINKMNDTQEISEVRTANPHFITDDQAKEYIARQEMGKLTAEQWSVQDWVEIVKPPITMDKARIIGAAYVAFDKLMPEARSELRKRINPNNVAALESVGIPII